MKKGNLSIFKKNISGWVLMIPSILLFVIIVWRPIIIGISYSFFKLEGFSPIQFVGLANYKDVITDTNFLRTLSNTVKYVCWSLVIGFPLPFIAAVMINEMVHIKSFFKLTTYMPVLVPAMATSIIWTMIFMGGPSGLLNMLTYRLGMEPVDWLLNKKLVVPFIIVSMTWSGFGGTLLIYLSSLQGISQELYEAARLDGAGVFARIRYVLFPYMRGVLLLMAIKQIIGVFNVTEQPLVMTGGGPNGASLTLGLTNYFYAFKYGQYDKSLALGVVTFCLLLTLTFVYNALEKKLDE